MHLIIRVNLLFNLRQCFCGERMAGPQLVPKRDIEAECRKINSELEKVGNAERKLSEQAGMNTI